MTTLVEKVLAVHDAFETAEIRHAFGGALALAYATEEPRGTRDIDVNVFARAEQVDAVFGNPNVTLAGGRTELQWPGDGPPTWYDEAMSAIVGRVDLGPERLQPPPPTYAPAGANLLARLELFERVGGFSEAHFRHMDFEFGQRCLARGEAVAYEPRLVVTAPVEAAILTQRYFRRWSFKAGISP